MFAVFILPFPTLLPPFPPPSLFPVTGFEHPQSQAWPWSLGCDRPGWQEECFGGMCVCECSVAQWCLTLCHPMDCRPPGFSVHGIFPGKNTGLGALPKGVCPSQSPRTHPCPRSFSHGIQQRAYRKTRPAIPGSPSGGWRLQEGEAF